MYQQNRSIDQFLLGFIELFLKALRGIMLSINNATNGVAFPRILDLAP